MSHALAGRRILIVEDEFMIAMMLEDMLAELGCIVAGVASRPEQALSAIETTEIDAAILDVNLDGVDSYGIAGELRKRGIPFVFATGYGGSRIPEAFADYIILPKPYRLDDVDAALRRIPFGPPPSPRQ